MAMMKALNIMKLIKIKNKKHEQESIMILNCSPQPRNITIIEVFATMFVIVICGRIITLICLHFIGIQKSTA